MVEWSPGREFFHARFNQCTPNQNKSLSFLVQIQTPSVLHTPGCLYCAKSVSWVPAQALMVCLLFVRQAEDLYTREFTEDGALGPHNISVPHLSPGDGSPRIWNRAALLHANHPLPSSSEVANELELYLCLPSVPAQAYHGVTFYFNEKLALFLCHWHIS